MNGEGERSNPFPGPRSFEEDEDHLFFGRERDLDELLRRLRTSRFLAVLGASGCGKSSLVKSGLIPSLYAGFMSRAGSSWRIGVLRPGEDPISRLAEALNSPRVLGPEAGGDGDRELAALNRSFLDANLRRGDLGLVQCAREARLEDHDRVLIVVDQFEELFRFQRSQRIEDAHDQAVRFVRTLLAATRQEELPIYVVLTMRSDFIGNCTEVPGLARAVNRGQYLVPLMDREQRRSAITGPVAVGGGEISQRLVVRLLNDAGDDPDQLPILQHALMRTWDRWENDHSDSEPLDLRHYEAIGTLSDALDRHAEEAVSELGSQRRREIAERLFKALTDVTTDPRGVRRPIAVADAAGVCEADEAEVAAVVEIFRRPGRSFLMPPAAVALEAASILDVSHESLMRCWTRLVEWSQEERRSAEAYLRLARAAARHEEGTAGLWRDPELELGLQWRRQTRPAAAWAERYDPSFARAIRFLDASAAERARRREKREEGRRRKLRLARGLAAMAGAAALIILAFGLYAVAQRRQAVEQQERAEIEAEAARQVSQFMVDLFEVSDPSEALGNEITARQILDRGAERIREELGEQPLPQARMMDTIGSVYRSLGLYEPAIPLLEEALEIRQKELVGDHLEVAASLLDIAELQHDRGRLDEARTLYERSLAMRERILGSAHPDVAESLTKVARLYQDQGRLAEAEPLFQRSLAIREEALGRDHPDVGRSLVGLATLYFDQRRYGEAEPLFQRSREILEPTLGPDHPDVNVVVNNLGQLYLDTQRGAEAEPLLLRALESSRRVLGRDHPDVAQILDNLVVIYWDLDRPAEALPLARQSLAIRQRTLPADHPKIGVSLYNLADLHRTLGEPEEAEPLFRRSLEVTEQALGFDHEDTRGTLQDYADLLRELGRETEAAAWEARLPDTP